MIHIPEISSLKLSRRRLLTGAGALGATGRLKTLPSAQAQDAPPVLRILGWPSYLAPEITQSFRERYRARIEVTGIGTLDDAMLFLRAGGVGLYDLVVPTSGLIPAMAEAGLIESIDPTVLTNLPALFPQFSADGWMSAGDHRYGVPLLWGTLPLAYSPDRVSIPPAAWTDLSDEEYTGQIVMPDDALGHFWIWNRALGADDPTRVSRDELNRTVETLISLKKDRATAFTPSVLSALQSIAGGKGTIATVGWQSAPFVPAPGQSPLVTAHPMPGDASFCDCLAIVSGTGNRELAHAFIDDMISTGTQAALINQTNWATVTPHAVPDLEPAIAELYDYAMLDAWLTVSPIRGYPPLTDNGDGIATYLDWVVAWDGIRSARM